MKYGIDLLTCASPNSHARPEDTGWDGVFIFDSL
jgi:hypothetical protein